MTVCRPTRRYLRPGWRRWRPLAHGVPQPFVLLTTMSGATQKVPARDVLREAAFSARVGTRVDEKALREFLVRMGFSQTSTVTEPGDYALRGGIIDIFPPGEGGPVRLDMFGDVLDGARRFDPATQRTTEKLKLVELAPVSEVILDEAAITRFRQNYRIEFGAAGTDDPLYEAVSAGRKHAGMEHWLPFFHERPGNPVRLSARGHRHAGRPGDTGTPCPLGRDRRSV